MDAVEQTGSVYALAVAMAKSLPPEDLTRAALQSLGRNTAAGDAVAADLSAL